MGVIGFGSVITPAKIELIFRYWTSHDGRGGSGSGGVGSSGSRVNAVDIDPYSQH